MDRCQQQNFEFSRKFNFLVTKPSEETNELARPAVTSPLRARLSRNGAGAPRVAPTDLLPSKPSGPVEPAPCETPSAESLAPKNGPGTWRSTALLAGNPVARFRSAVEILVWRTCSVSSQQPGSGTGFSSLGAPICNSGGADTSSPKCLLPVTAGPERAGDVFLGQQLESNPRPSCTKARIGKAGQENFSALTPAQEASSCLNLKISRLENPAAVGPAVPACAFLGLQISCFDSHLPSASGPCTSL